MDSGAHFLTQRSVRKTHFSPAVTSRPSCCRLRVNAISSGEEKKTCTDQHAIFPMLVQQKKSRLQPDGYLLRLQLPISRIEDSLAARAAFCLGGQVEEQRPGRSARYRLSSLRHHRHVVRVVIWTTRSARRLLSRRSASVPGWLGIFGYKIVLTMTVKELPYGISVHSNVWT
jgi:hypothetical protein